MCYIFVTYCKPTLEDGVWLWTYDYHKIILKMYKQTLLIDRETHEAKDNHVVDNAMGIVMDKQVNLSDSDSSMEQSLNLFGKVITMLLIISTFGELIIHFFKTLNPVWIVAREIGGRWSYQGNITYYAFRHTTIYVNDIAFVNIYLLAVTLS